MSRTLILLLYNLLYPLILLAMLPGALRKMKARGGKWADLWQRLGFFKPGIKAQLATLHERGEVFWVHAVSVGEIGIAAKLIHELVRQRPSLGVVLTTTTPTGMAQALRLSKALPGAVAPLYSPLDGWFTARRCLRAIKPSQLILVEAEVWPNLVLAARRRGLPVSLVNARLSPRSERRYKTFRFLVAPVFSALDRVFVQEPEDVARWVSLGVPGRRVTLTGSIKFDMAGDLEPVEQIRSLRTLLLEEGVKPSRPVLLAASTHPGEEIEIARVFLKLKLDHPSLFLILVPRHVERSETLQKELGGMELKVRRRSMVERLNTATPDALLVDTTGELRAWQALATMVVIGKSFLATGGQNPAEAIMAGRPVLFGPHMENFEALVRALLARRGALQVRDFPGLTAAVDRLLRRPDEARALAAAGLEALRAHEGATARTAAALLKA